MTAILPARTSAPDQMHVDLVRLLDAALFECAILRRQLGAVVDGIVHDEMTVHRNRAEHPFTDEELADIETSYHHRWAQVALNAAKEQQL